MKLFYFILLVFLSLPSLLFAQLDTTFNHNGKILDRTGTFRAKVLIDSDSSILVLNGAGYESPEYGFPKLVRLKINGSICQNFGQDAGFYGTLPISFYPWLTNLIITPDGKLLLSAYSEVYWQPGWPSMDFNCIRLYANGQTDLGFGDSGKVTTDLSYMGIWGQMQHLRDVPTAVGIQPDGKIILYGESDKYLAWVRYLPDGTIDSSFGVNGISVVYIANGYLQGTNDMVILPDGKILSCFWGIGSTNMGLVRLLPDGAVDSSFNKDGISGYYGGWLTYCKGMEVLPDGKILVVGFSDSGLVLRFNESGSIDSTFGLNGVSKLPCEEAVALVSAPDGKILVTGDKDSTFLIFRLLPDGKPDTTFGIRGMLSSRPDSTGNNRVASIALQLDGKILVGGYAEHWLDGPPPQSWDNYVLVRYLPDGRPPTKSFARDSSKCLLVYPNPSQKKLMLHWNGREIEHAVIFIYDASGRRLISKELPYLNQQPATLDISNLTPGSYFVEVSNNQGRKAKQKFIKE